MYGILWCIIRRLAPRLACSASTISPACRIVRSHQLNVVKRCEPLLRADPTALDHSLTGYQRDSVIPRDGQPIVIDTKLRAGLRIRLVMLAVRLFAAGQADRCMVLGWVCWRRELGVQGGLCGLAVVGAAGSRVPRRNPTISPALENLFCQSPPINGRRIWQPWLGPSLCRLLKAREAQLRRWRWSILGHDRPESGRRAPGKQLKNPTSI